MPLPTKLSGAQARNLARLTEIGGTWTYTASSKVLAPRWGNRYEKSCGYRLSYTEKGSHKGFHRVAMDSLVGMGLVSCKAVESGGYDGDSRNIGDHDTTTYTYTLV